MDWDAKMVSWDFTEGAVTGGGGAGGSIFSHGAGMGGEAAARFPDCSVDLKLGVFGELVQGSAPRKVPNPALSGSAPAVPSPVAVKRPRPGHAEAPQNVSCLVEGCRADLSKCRDYHRRHKVCEAHSKTPVVIVAGQEQRFCQQCSRFHHLVEFDDVKRSCRKRLDAHNMRRRKQHPDALNPGSFFANYQVSRFPAYPQILSTSLDSKWAGIIKAEESPMPPDLLNKDRKAFSFLQNSDAAMLESSNSSRKLMFGGSGMSHVDSNCALSLLSSPTPIPAALLGQMVASSAAPAPSPAPIITELPFGAAHAASGSGVSFTGFSCHGGRPDQQLDHYQLYNVAGDSSPEDEAMPAHPFPWY